MDPILEGLGVNPKPHILGVVTQHISCCCALWGMLAQSLANQRHVALALADTTAATGPMLQTMLCVLCIAVDAWPRSLIADTYCCRVPAAAGPGVTPPAPGPLPLLAAAALLAAAVAATYELSAELAAVCTAPRGPVLSGPARGPADAELKAT
jgi:hypothetical protein